MRRMFSKRQESPRRNRLSKSGLHSSSFVYTPLREADEIRLLNIAPRSATDGNRGLQDSIQHVLLSASPLYIAISWMWGRPGDLVEFEVGGHTLMVQRNLSRVIDHLRDDYQTRRVWIDAICIDQHSLQERNHQVQMMGQIYRNASYVVACLNAARPRDSKRLKREAQSLHTTLREGQHFTKTSRYRHFFGNQYFTRRWIIQEISHAQAVVICCEGHLVPMSILRDAIKVRTLEANRDAKQGYSVFSETEKMAESRAIQLCSMEPPSQSVKTSLEDLLYLHETAECLDFRDKIYALISLSPEAQTHLTVHYDIDRLQLMLTVLRFCCKHQRLSTFGTLGFMSFLRQHLEVERDELHNGILYLGKSPALSDSFAINGTVRGKIETLHPGRDVEEAALRVRPLFPALIPRQTIFLSDRGPSNALEIDTKASINTQASATVGIPGADQCLFAFTGNPLRDEASTESTEDPDSPPEYVLATPNTIKGPLFAGLASTRVNVLDEIWQFDRTPVAIIARMTPEGYILVGRAFLIRDLRVGEQRTPSRLEDEIVWIKDGTKHAQTTPAISVDLKGLHDLMCWVNFDQ